MKVRATSIKPIGDDGSPELTIHLVLAGGEDSRADDVQKEFTQADSEFREVARTVQHRVDFQKSATGGSWLAGQWILQLVGALGVSGALTAFITRHNGRRVRIKIGEFEAEATNPKELEKVVEQALEVKRQLESKGDKQDS
jgi:hypothetical protein